MGLIVCMVDRSQATLVAAAKEIGSNATPFVVDVTDSVAIHRLATEVADRLGPVSFLMNNAGIGDGGDALSNPDVWTRVLDVNLFGVLHGVQVFVPAMVARDRPGIVVNTGSKQGITQPPDDTAYNVSKAAVKALTEGLAHTLRQQTEGRVTAHLLIPGFTFTGLTRASEKPPGAWSSEQVVDFMFDGIAAGDLYLPCPDNETTRAMDEKRIAWAAGDIIENQPALSR
jgi:NAD(P)-dependent dehydrogenase (short-subunit alcohol dehydrogenase family)